MNGTGRLYMYLFCPIIIIASAAIEVPRYLGICCMQIWSHDRTTDGHDFLSNATTHSTRALRWSAGRRVRIESHMNGARHLKCDAHYRYNVPKALRRLSSSKNLYDHVSHGSFTSLSFTLNLSSINLEIYRTCVDLYWTHSFIQFFQRLPKALPIRSMRLYGGPNAFFCTWVD